MADGLDELEDRQERRRRAAGASRNPRPTGSGSGSPPEETEAERAAKARAERQRREQEEAQRAEAQRRAEEEAQRLADEEAQREAQRRAEEEAQRGTPKRGRPKATPVYLDPDIERWLWQIRETAARLHVDVPVSAVARRAFRELMRTQTPAQIVADLSRTPEEPAEGTRRGRPRR